jgi:hypothetical protein
MVIRIEYQPQGLTYSEFAKVDRECFPDEPGDEGLYQAFLSRDFWAAWDGETLAGYCRLSPEFPGCFPFAVTHPEANLPGALLSMQKYLLPEKDHLNLTLSDRPLAEACEALGLKLNCKLFRMELIIGGVHGKQRNRP